MGGQTDRRMDGQAGRRRPTIPTSRHPGETTTQTPQNPPKPPKNPPNPPPRDTCHRFSGWLRGRAGLPWDIKVANRAPPTGRAGPGVPHPLSHREPRPRGPSRHKYGPAARARRPGTATATGSCAGEYVATGRPYHRKSQTQPNKLEKMLQAHPKAHKSEAAPKHHQHLGHVASVPRGTRSDATEDLPTTWGPT
ncbi:proline-rich protein 13-like [Caloenas nicobarica]|uniref:proline-rich protein 13-like n=1 Tax=Caloenas nicobarica TaxID=187106 RepID=UPI0032B82948